MTITTELAQRMRTAAEKATKGEWWSDEVKNEGEFGSGDDCVSGFTSYAIYGSDGQTLFDSLNSDAACISEEYDGEGHVAWDETAQRNAEFIALANPANVLALLDALAAKDKQNLFLKEQLEQLANFNPDWDRLEAVNDSLREHAAELKAARERIAELEARTEQQPALYLCPVTRNGEALYSPCGRDYPRGRGYYTEAPAAQPVTVKLPDLHVGVVQSGHAVMVPYPAGHWFNKTAILEMLSAAGITIAEGE